MYSCSDISSNGSTTQLFGSPTEALAALIISVGVITAFVLGMLGITGVLPTSLIGPADAQYMLLFSGSIISIAVTVCLKDQCD